ncbi:hypothetical protein COLO4_37828 [Corchorus olitorius]|uniref:Uncharacterized protein n=1 Tax=Corchorus olitorius TaxID=93759 RepID=A0A1R3FZ16_9ROSI|nr:hypothetical protein COLO4_37828 [Corchorus olitorius]
MVLETNCWWPTPRIKQVFPKLAPSEQGAREQEQEKKSQQRGKGKE